MSAGLRQLAEAAEIYDSPWSVGEWDDGYSILYATDHPLAGLVARCADYLPLDAAAFIAAANPQAVLALLDERDDLDESLTQAAQSMSDLGTELNEALDERDALAARVAAAEALGAEWIGFDDSHFYGDAVLKALGAAGDEDRACVNAPLCTAPAGHPGQCSGDEDRA